MRVLATDHVWPSLDVERCAIAAALDVRGQEPPDAGDRLIQMEQVIHTPHAAFFSEESLVELQEKAAWEVRRVLTGEAPVHLVNPDYEKQ